MLGGSGYIGRHLVRRLGSDRSVATFNATKTGGGHRFDALTMTLQDIAIDLDSITDCVILLGNVNPDWCVKNRARSAALNVTAIHKIIDQLIELGIKPLFASTEVVFDGKKGRYREEDPVNPILVYGEQKLKVEGYLRERCDDFIIARIAKVYGTSRGDGTILTGWAESLADGLSALRAATDYISSPIHVDDTVAFLAGLVENQCRGVYHLAGPEPLSRYGMAEILIEQMRAAGMSKEIALTRCSIDDFETVEGRPHDVSMIADKVQAATGLAPLTVNQACRSLVGDLRMTQ